MPKSKTRKKASQAKTVVSKASTPKPKTEDALSFKGASGTFNATRAKNTEAMAEVLGKAADSPKYRIITHVNTDEGLKIMPFPIAEPQAEESKEAKSGDTTGCTQKRPNGQTCLEEMQAAKITPHRYSSYQREIIAAGANLCEYCLEQE